MLSNEAIDTEKWAPIVGYEGLYAVSNRGRIRREAPGKKTFPGKILAQTKDNVGYFGVKLCRDGKVKAHRVHVLVAFAFIGQRPDGMDVCHNDGDRSNNLLSNLRYDTRRGNLLDMNAHGTSSKGEHHVNARLTYQNAIEIRSMLESGETMASLSVKYHVSESVIFRIKHKKSYLPCHHERSAI